jgi:Rrf2 family protein
MRLTTKGRYGMRLVLDIAQHGSDGPVSMSEVSLRQDISLKYLERLVGELQRAGIVKSMRGRVGGHVLALPPERVTVGDVVRALEGESADLPCGNNRLACPRSVHCLTRAIWVAADQAMFEKLDSVTVKDILEDGQNCMAKKEEAKFLLIKEAQAPPAEQQKRRKTLPSRVFLHSATQQGGDKQGRPGEGVKTILTVDDNPDIVEYLVSIFRERGYAAYGATSGEEAMETLMRLKPDLITLDLEMPDEWGPKFHQRYSKMAQFKDIPVVVISGLPGIHRAIRKAVATLSKPFRPEDVLDIVESAIGAP